MSSHEIKIVDSTAYSDQDWLDALQQASADLDSEFHDVKCPVRYGEALECNANAVCVPANWNGQ